MARGSARRRRWVDALRVLVAATGFGGGARGVAAAKARGGGPIEKPAGLKQHPPCASKQWVTLHGGRQDQAHRRIR